MTSYIPERLVYSSVLLSTKLYSKWSEGSAVPPGLEVDFWAGQFDLLWCGVTANHLDEDVSVCSTAKHGARERPKSVLIGGASYESRIKRWWVRWWIGCNNPEITETCLRMRGPPPLRTLAKQRNIHIRFSKSQMIRSSDKSYAPLVFCSTYFPACTTHGNGDFESLL